MNRLWRPVASLLLFLAVALPVSAAPAASQYLRVVRDSKGAPRLLQTGVAHVVLGSGQRVDLVGAVHMAEGPYYDGLNRRFKGYDAVLYELIVATSGKGPVGPIVIPRDDDGGSGLSQVQLKLCRMLGLKFQLHSVDYAAANFRHADLTAEEFHAMMRQRGESTSGLLMKILQMALSNVSAVDGSELDDVDLLALLMRAPTPREQQALRRVFAQCFPQIERLTADIQGTTLISGRNGRAVEVLKQQLKAGRQRLAIFYGAGHMADLEARVLRLPGARLQGREWLDAWHLEPRPR